MERQDPYAGFGLSSDPSRSQNIRFGFFGPLPNESGDPGSSTTNSSPFLFPNSVSPPPWLADPNPFRAPAPEEHGSQGQDGPELEDTIIRMTQDLERFQSPTPSGHSAGGGEEVTPTRHDSMENLHRPKNHRTRFSRTGPQAMVRVRIVSDNGEKPNNITDENQMLYQALDRERQALILRKGLCSFMYGALRRQSDRVLTLEIRNKGKVEECAARVILHNLLLNSFRKTQAQLSQITGENGQLQKSVENLCLQLRVIRHLQSAEKERAIEKAHEINTLKSEVAFVKKQLNKTKSELEKVEKECEAATAGNEQISEEKTQIQRELRSLEDRKGILQGSLDLERKRGEKHMSELRALKRQINELRLQVTGLTSTSDQWQERARSFEAKNWEIQLQLEARGKEFTDLSRNRDSLKAQNDDFKEENEKLYARNSELEGQLRLNHKETLKLKRSLAFTESQLEQQLGRIGQLENAVINIQREGSIMKAELMDYKLQNLRKRRSWVTLAMKITSPFETFVHLILGSEQRTPTATTWERYASNVEDLKEDAAPEPPDCWQVD